MLGTWCHAPPRLVLLLAADSLLLPDSGQAASRNEKPKIPAVRWEEERPGCTFSRGDDGRYHYGLRYEDIGINVAVDSQDWKKFIAATNRSSRCCSTFATRARARWVSAREIFPSNS